MWMTRSKSPCSSSRAICRLCETPKRGRGGCFRIVRRQCHRLARLVIRHDLWGDEQIDAMLAHRSEDELRTDVAAALESLPESYLDVILLRDFEGLTIGEMVRRLKVTPAAVKSRLHRARELVREYLS